MIKRGIEEGAWIGLVMGDQDPAFFIKESGVFVF